MKNLTIWAMITGGLLLAMTGGRAHGEDQCLEVNISVKVILHPSDGLWPRENYDVESTRITQAGIEAGLADANNFLTATNRGIRLRIIEYKEIGGFNQTITNSASTAPGYFSKHRQLTWRGINDAWMDPLEEAAQGDKQTWKWNNNAVNMFVTSHWGGGEALFPGSSTGNFTGDAAGFGIMEGWLILHELGHYFNLNHTFDNDGVADTLVDPNSVTQDAVAQSAYGRNYGALTEDERTFVDAEYARRARNSIAAANSGVLTSDIYFILQPYEKVWVDDVFFNLMSYYDPPHRNEFVTRITEGQADRFTDACNGVRRHAVSGYTRFVSPVGVDTVANDGTGSASPLRTVGAAAARAGVSAGDDEILLLRPGNYNEQVTVTTPCTLRATRNGAAVIGKP